MLDRMVELQKLWDDALVDAAKTKAAKENTAGDGSVQEQASKTQYQIKYPRFTEKDIERNSVTLQSMSPVEHLTGDELGARNLPLKTRVTDYFNSLGNNVYTEQFGDVALKNSSVHSEFRHGNTLNKVATYAAIPAVMKNGYVIYAKPKNDMGLERIVVAAPVTVGESAEKMYVAVMLQRDTQNQRLYLHDVVTETEKELSASSNEHLNTTGPKATSKELYATNILLDALRVKGDVRASDENSNTGNPGGSQNQRGVKEKFSLRDSAGNALTAEQQEFFKDSQVRDDDGRLKVMYRGGNGDFTVFDRRKSKHSNLYGRGFYFTDSESHAQQYGNARAFYLNIQHPVSTTETTITRIQMQKFLDAVAENEDDFSFENYGYGATVDSVLNSVYGKSDFAMLYDVDQTAIGDMVAAVELFNEVNGTNYDGLILDTETVAFRSNQIKNTTNKAPTSDADIRFSLREYSEDEKKQHIADATKFFGKTYKWAETGYLTPGGTKLDFSGRHDGAPGGYRTVDHRDISDALGLDYGGEDYSGAMIQFMREGNIRIMPESGGIDLIVKPTQQQEDALVQFVQQNRGEVMLDIDDANGNTIASVEYDRGTRSATVIGAIRDYFDYGVVPENPDVQYSVRDYSYETLTAKPDMRVTKVDDSASYRPAREARKEIVARAIANAKKIGRTNENGNAVVRVADTGDEVILSAKGLRHGLDRRFSVNAPVTLKAGEIIRNAIRINEFTPENAQVDASYALIGAAKNVKNEPYIVQFVVNRISNEVTDVDVLYAVNAKKEPGALLPDVTGTDAPAILTDSVISIRSLLDYVNRYFPDVLPESVLRHYNHDRRPEGKLGESALYQRRDDTRTDRDVLSDAADGDAANVREMEMLREYREKLQKYSSLTRRLEQQRELAQNAESKEERLKARNRADNLAAQVSRADAQLTRMQNAKPLRELVARELKTRDSLAKENAMLRDRVEYWRGQTRRTEEATTDPKAVREAAKDIIKQTGSSIDADEVAGRLQELYDGIARATGDNGLTYAEIQQRADDLAHDILNDVTAVDDTMYREYEDLRRYFKGQQLVVSAADRGEIPDFGDFRRRNMGRMRLKNGERTNVDQVYAELSELYPEFFDQNRESQPSDQLYRIADVLDAVYSVNEYNPNAQYMREATQSVGNEILEQFFDLPQQRTFADRQAKKDEQQKTHYLNQINELREANDTRIAELRAQNRKRLQEAIAREREKRDEQIARLKDRNAEDKARREESAAVAKYRPRIEQKAKRLSDWLLKNSDKEQIPEPLKLAVGEFLESIDFTSRRALRGGEPTAKDAERARRYTDRMQKLLDSLRGQNEDGTSDLGLYLDIPDGFLEEMQTHISIAADIISQNPGENVVNRMNGEHLQQLDRMLTILTRSIQNANKLKANAHFESARQAAQATVLELERLGQAKGRTKAGEKAAGFFNWENTTPYYAFQRFGEGGKAIFEALSDGWDKMAFNTKAVMDFTEQTYTPKEVKAWAKETHTFKLESGESVRMTTAQMMAFYCLSKREQAAGHLLGGGMRVEDIQNSGRKENVKQPDPFLLTQEDIAAINGALTKRQREVADKLQKYMNDQGGAWGNRVSMERFGYRAFTEENYFPIETMDSNRDAKDPGAKENDMFRLLNMSATKSLVYKANNALVVRDIFDVFSNHMADMAKYDALALPILDAMKWYNYREKQKLENGHVLTTTVQRSIEKAYGMDANKYFTTFIKDLNGVNEGGRGEGFAKKMLSNYKVAAVAANLRVALLQPTAYVRAVGVMSPKYLAKAFTEGKSAYKEAEANSGIALWKHMGFYDTNIGMNIRDQIKNAGTWKDSTVEFLMKGAEWGDRLTWGRLWNACKAEIRDKQKLTGDALLKATAERFREVVYSTQVVDSTMTRSQAMRGKSVYGSISTAFMSEPTLSYNLVLKAYTDYTTELRTTGDKKKAWNNAKGKVAWALATYLVSAAASGLVESAVDACRDDDEYATWLEKYLNALIGANYEEGKFSGVRPFDNNLFSDVDILSKLPILKDFMSMISGYGNDRMDTEWISNLIDAYRIWDETIKLATGKLDKPTDVTYNGNMTLYGKIYKTLKAVSQATGLPISAASREVVTLWNTIAGAVGKGDEWTIHTYDSGPESQIKYGLMDGYLTREEAQQLLVEKGLADNEDDAYWKVDKWETGEGKYDEALAAVLSGDKAAFDAQAKELKEHGIGEKQLQSAVRSQAKEWYVGDDDGKRSITKEQALKILQQYGGKDADEAQKMVQKWTCEVVTGTDYDDIKDLYLDGKLTRSRAVDMLVRYGGMKQEDAQNKIDTADFVKAHPECDGISVEAVQKYNEQAKPAGLDAGTFWDAYQFKNDAKTTYDSNGKAIKGQGTMDKVAAYIDGLNISREQKNALFLCFYSQKSLGKIRWSN